MKRKLILVLAVCLSIVSCKKVIDSVDKLGSKEKIKIEDLKIISVEDRYSLSVPKYMSEMKSLNDDASFEYANIYKETYTVVIDENKQDFIDTFKELEIYKDSLSILDNYSYYQMESFKESMEVASYRDLNSKIGKFNSSQFEFEGDIEGIKAAYLVSFIESNQDIYMIMSWTLKNRYNKYKSMFLLTHNTFKLK